MRKTSIYLFLLLCLCSGIQPLKAQFWEHTYNVVPDNVWDEAWKVIPQRQFGYVMVGNLYFEPVNPKVYMLEFDEFGNQNWIRNFDFGKQTQLWTFWKSFCPSNYPQGYFIATSGYESGTFKIFTILSNATGQAFYTNKIIPPDIMDFSSACQTTDGGFFGGGGDGSGNMAICKFNNVGELLWMKSYTPGWGASIVQAPGGGYYVAGAKRLWKIDYNGDLEWERDIQLPKDPNGSAYDGGEFEEITLLPNNQGFVVTGTGFSPNGFSTPYLARFNYDGGQLASYAYDPTQFWPNYQVAWINNAVVDDNNQLLVTWRKGPALEGGVMKAVRTDFTGKVLSAFPLNNKVPVREAYMVKKYGRYVIGGTTGYGLPTNYNFLWYSYITFNPGGGSLTGSDDRSEIDGVPAAPATSLTEKALGARSTYNTRLSNDKLTPYSRRFYVDFNVYPNPATDYLTVSMGHHAGGQLRVLDATGKVALSRAVTAEERLVELNLGALPKGIYWLELSDSAGVTTKKFVVE